MQQKELGPLIKSNNFFKMQQKEQEQKEEQQILNEFQLQQQYRITQNQKNIKFYKNDLMYLIKKEIQKPSPQQIDDTLNKQEMDKSYDLELDSKVQVSDNDYANYLNQIWRTSVDQLECFPSLMRLLCVQKFWTLAYKYGFLYRVIIAIILVILIQLGIPVMIIYQFATSPPCPGNCDTTITHICSVCQDFCPNNNSKFVNKVCGFLCLLHLNRMLNKDEQDRRKSDTILFRSNLMNNNLVFWPYLYDVIIRILVEIVTFILFVSNSDIIHLLLNSLAIFYLNDLDDFFGRLISSRLTISLVREFIFGKIKCGEFEFEEICVQSSDFPFFTSNSKINAFEILGYLGTEKNLAKLITNLNFMKNPFYISSGSTQKVSFKDFQQLMIKFERKQDIQCLNQDFNFENKSTLMARNNLIRDDESGYLWIKNKYFNVKKLLFSTKCANGFQVLDTFTTFKTVIQIIQYPILVFFVVAALVCI